VSEFFSSFSALTVFLIIAGVGFLFLLASLVVGDLFEHFGVDGGFDSAPDGPGFLDSRVISVFVTSFGGFGAISTQAGFGIVTSSFLGLAGGIVLGGIVSLFGRFLYKQQATSSVRSSQLVGRTAQVTVTIQSGNVGQITCRVGEERVEKLARARDGKEIKTGAIVRVEELAGDSVIVSVEDGTKSFQVAKQDT